MGTSAEGEGRDRRDLRARGLARFPLRWGRLTELVLGLVVVLGLWLTVAPVDAASRWGQLSLGAVAVAGLMTRFRLPVLAVAVTAAATAGAWLLGVTADPFVLTGLAVFGLAETRGKHRFPWWMFLGAITVALTSVFFRADGVEDHFRGMLLSVAVLSAAWVLGVRTREVEREASARSRAEERLRLARDVHDVLSHSLGAIGVRAGVTAHVTTLEREELRGVLREIEGDARSSLAELKVLLRRERTEVDADTSLPLSAGLEGVVRTADSVGIAVLLDSDGPIDALPAAVRTTVLRVVQEAVTNAIRHAETPSLAVDLRASTDTVSVRVSDAGRGAPSGFVPGHGLTGMRERVELVGGTLDVLSSPDGFIVSAEFPVAAPPVAGHRR